MVFSAGQRTNHQLIMALDMPTISNDEMEDDEMAPAPVTFNTFALPLRLGAPRPSTIGTPGTFEQQHDSDAISAHDRKDDMPMELD